MTRRSSPRPSSIPRSARTLADDLGITTAVLDPIESQTDVQGLRRDVNSSIDAPAKALDCQ